MRIWLLALALAALVASPAAATTLYSTPKSTRTTQPCAQATPCKLDYAMLAANSGDDVSIAPGDYYDSGTTPYAGLPPVRSGVTVQGSSSTGLPTLHGHVGAGGVPFLEVQGGGALRDVELVSDIAAGVPSGTTLHVGEAGMAERIIARGTAISGNGSMVACFLDGPLYDSLCVGGGPGHADGIAVYSPASVRNFAIRNVTAIATGQAGFGLSVATDTSNVTVTGTNVIAIGPTAVGLNTNVSSGSATLTLDHSIWGKYDLTGTGMNHLNIGPANNFGINFIRPLFVNEGAGDYRPARGSSSIDKGAASTSALALGGVARSLGAATDVGAYEYLPVPTAVSGAATNVTDSGATLNGTATPDGAAPFTSRFEYGTTTSYGRTATTTGTGAVTAALTGLAPNTTYHYRLVATSPGGGTGRGQDRTFRTSTPTAGAQAALVSAVSIGKRWRLGRHLPHFSRRRPPVGTTIRFTLSKGARVTLKFTQRVKKGRRTRVVRRGTLTSSGFAGANKVRFEGRLSRKRKLKPGRYLLTIAVAGSSRSSSASFTIVR